jgi:hypothetical protein
VTHPEGSGDGAKAAFPPAARAMGVSDPFNPEESVDGAARFLKLDLRTLEISPC